MRMFMAVRMRVGGAVRMGVAVFVPMRVVVSMLVTSMIVRLVRMKVLDPLLALAAAAGAAHQTTSISLRRISSPP
jgi:hypothetical protein